MKEKKNILIAIRGHAQAESIREILAYNLYNVVGASTAKTINLVLDKGHTHMLLMDMSLPGTGGLALIKNLRKNYEIPIVVLSESIEESTIVSILDAGANDVLALPFGRPEHLARIRAILRYSSNVLGHARGGEFSAGGLFINYDSRSLYVNGKAVHLTPIEFRIITLLTFNAGKVLTHEQIINEIWGPYNTDNLVLRVNMANIRRKIEANPAEPKYVLTEVGVGYRVISE